jgi:mRNA interferase HigB
MRLITARYLRDCAQHHPTVQQAVADWIAMIEAARWTSADDAIRTSAFPVRAVPEKRLIFNLLHNRFRLICSVQYADSTYHGIVRVQFFGTHAEYDKIQAETVRPPGTST